jgi:SAM-dependent methyltransferase
MGDDTSPVAVFTEIYRNNSWGEGSGPGAKPAATRTYRQALQRLLETRRVRSVVDVGCGDWASSQFIDWKHATYHGVDVVDTVIQANTQKYARRGVTFECVDALDHYLWPPADLLLCKDVLQHWPIASIRYFCANVIPRYPLALVTNDIASPSLTEQDVNAEIMVGGWRTLDLEAAPFQLVPAWHFDYEIPGEETKRVYLFEHLRG